LPLIDNDSSRKDEKQVLESIEKKVQDHYKEE